MSLFFLRESGVCCVRCDGLQICTYGVQVDGVPREVVSACKYIDQCGQSSPTSRWKNDRTRCTIFCVRQSEVRSVKYRLTFHHMLLKTTVAYNSITLPFLKVLH